MSRHQFRSQPELQRSSGPSLPMILAIVLFVGAAVLVGAVVSMSLGLLAPQPENEQVLASLDEPVPLAAAEPQPLAESAPLAPQPVAAQARPEAPPIRVMAATTAAGPRRTQPPAARAIAAASPQGQDDQGVTDEAGQRAAGFSWAQQNQVRALSQCAAAAKRTPAFMAGCRNYVRSGPPKGSDDSPP